MHFSDARGVLRRASEDGGLNVRDSAWSPNFSEDWAENQRQDQVCSAAPGVCDYSRA